jgi:hypothetical protein
LTLNRDIPCPINPLATHGVYAKGKMERISTMIPINISKTHGVVKDFFVGAYFSLEDIQTYIELFKQFRDFFSWSYEEMSGIDPRIVKHEIMNYPNAKQVGQKLRPINIQKVVAINAEVEKLLKINFIYPVQLTEWVSNPVHVNKKQGMIHVCMDFHDLKKACLKDNFPTTFIDHIVD